jgi:hypothetical protein
MMALVTAVGLVVIAMPAFTFLAALFVLWAKEIEVSGTINYIKKTAILTGSLISVIAGLVYIAMVAQIYIRGGIID